MDIHCKRCQEPVTAENVNLNSHIAKCPSCDAVFDFRDQLTRTEAHKRSSLNAPKGIDLQTTMDGIQIVRRWFSAKAFGLLFFCLFWNGIMFFILRGAVTTGQFSGLGFASIHIVVGVGMAYYCLASFLNRTYIDISFRDIAIRHRPVPWWGGKKISLTDVEQVFSKEKAHRQKNGTRYTYQVLFRDHRGKDTKMVSGLEKPEQALYIEQEIESTLGIEDKPVTGELSSY